MLSFKTRAERFVSTLRHAQLLDITVEAAAGQTLTMRLPYHSECVGDTSSGVLHGGALTTLMDTTCGTLVFSALPGFELCPTLDFRVDYMRSAEAGLDAIAVASIVRISRHVVFTQCEVYQCEAQSILSDATRDDALIARCSATFMRIGADKTPLEYQALIEQRPSSLEFEALTPLKSENVSDINTRSLVAVIPKCQQEQDFQPLIQHIPYACLLGVGVNHDDQGIRFFLERRENNLGNPILPAIHGGVIGGFMELAAALHLIMSNDSEMLPKIIDFSIDYLRAGRDDIIYAECQVCRQGSRVANVAITAWQTDQTQPIATARAHFLLT